MLRLTPGMKVLIFALLLAGLPMVGQQNLPDGPKPKDQQPQQGVPDAPQPKPQQGQFPENAPPAPINAHPEQPEAAATPTPQPQPAAAEQKAMGTGREELYKMTVSVNFVQIPVRVR